MRPPVDPSAEQQARIRRWPSETPLFVLALLASMGLWFLLAISIFGLIYAAMIGVFFFVSHLVFIAHLRGSAVKLGPDQMPELHQRVETLARRVGLKRVPAVYVMQAGGALNALATRFLATDFVVLFSDLLEACDDDEGARDMIIGHELGHLKEGHLRWLWLLLPGLFVPFLGSAYARSREYTCDRYGAAVCEDKQSALRGLAILAAGGRYGRTLDLRALARQREDFDRGWMTIGHWLAAHPPLAHRAVAVAPDLDDAAHASVRGPLSALAILGGAFALPAIAVALFSLALMPAMQEALAVDGAALDTRDASPEFLDVDEDFDTPATVASLMGSVFARNRAEADILAIAGVVEKYARRTGNLPAGDEELMLVWQALRSDAPFPTDPFDGYWYGYLSEGARFEVWSAGPDAENPADDIRFVSGETTAGLPENAPARRQ
jgi:Zn-dependent protease with chaperone function